MEGEELDAVAQALQDAWARETHGTKIKWGHLRPEERSVWRHVARVAEAILKGGGKSAKAKAVPMPAGESRLGGAKAVPTLKGDGKSTAMQAVPTPKGDGKTGGAKAAPTPRGGSSAPAVPARPAPRPAPKTLFPAKR